MRSGSGQFAGVADGDLSDDRLRLPRGPLQVGAVSRVRLSHQGAGSDAYSSVRLVAVDHGSTDEALATQSGVVVGTRVAAEAVRDASGTATPRRWPPASGTRDWFLEVTGTPRGYQPSAGVLGARHAPVGEPEAGIHSFRLAGGMPNPFTSSARVLFELPRASTVRLEVFDMQGRLVRMVESRFEAGVQSLVWDRRTTAGAFAPRGVYPIRVTAGDERANGRLTVR